MFATKTLISLLPLFVSAAQSAPTTHQKFTLSEILFDSSKVYSTPAHLATYGGNINFNLSTTAVPETIHCSARGLHLNDYFYGELNYTCASPEGVATNFTYSRPGNAFEVNQTWSKGGKSYLASGTGSADLSCEYTNWTNPNWTMGQLYYTENVDCKPAKLAITPKVYEL